MGKYQVGYFHGVGFLLLDSAWQNYTAMYLGPVLLKGSYAVPGPRLDRISKVCRTMGLIESHFKKTFIYIYIYIYFYGDKFSVALR